MLPAPSTPQRCCDTAVVLKNTFLSVPGPLLCCSPRSRSSPPCLQNLPVSNVEAGLSVAPLALAPEQQQEQQQQVNRLSQLMIDIEAGASQASSCLAAARLLPSAAVAKREVGQDANGMKNVLPSLRRGYRTPDPSPSARAANGFGKNGQKLGEMRLPSTNDLKELQRKLADAESGRKLGEVRPPSTNDLKELQRKLADACRSSGLSRPSSTNSVCTMPGASADVLELGSPARCAMNMSRVASSGSVSNIARPRTSSGCSANGSCVSTSPPEIRRNAASSSSLCTMASRKRVPSYGSLCSMDPDDIGQEMEFGMTIEEESGNTAILHLGTELSEAERRPPTSVMIKNVPRWYACNDLAEELEELGFASAFDYLYLPTDSGTMSNGGYAFVNFLDETLATKCLHLLSTHRFRRRSGDEVATSSRQQQARDDPLT